MTTRTSHRRRSERNPAVNYLLAFLGSGILTVVGLGLFLRKPEALRPEAVASELDETVEKSGAPPDAKAPTYSDSVEFNDTSPAPEATPEPPESKKPLDLLSLVQLPRDATRGEWIRRERAIVSPSDTVAAILTVPVTVPESYELNLSLQRIEKNESFDIGIPIGESMAMIVFEGFDSKLSGLGVVSGKTLQGRPDVVRGPVFSSAVSQLVVRVTPRSIEVFCDGREIVDWQGDPRDLSIRKQFWKYQTGRLFLGSWKTGFLIHSATIQEL